jgi:hypothetical protein
MIKKRGKRARGEGRERGGEGGEREGRGREEGEGEGRERGVNNLLTGQTGVIERDLTSVIDQVSVLRPGMIFGRPHQNSYAETAKNCAVFNWMQNVRYLIINGEW